jgi:osmotically inducible lipoprotein OsmB
MKRIAATLAVVALMGLSGCANMDSTEQRVLSGSAIGAGLGAGVGALTGGLGIGVGAAIGAGVGAATGFLVDQVAD